MPKNEDEKKKQPELAKVSPEPPPARADGLPPPGLPPPAPPAPVVLPDIWEFLDAVSSLEELQALVKEQIDGVWLKASPPDRQAFSARLEAYVRSRGWDEAHNKELSDMAQAKAEAKPAAGPRRLTSAAMVTRNGARCTLPIGTSEAELVGVHPADVDALTKRADIWG